MSKNTLDRFLVEKKENGQKTELEGMIAEKEEILVDKDKVSHKKFAPIFPTNTDPLYLLSVAYDGKKGKAYLKLYDPEKKCIYFWWDNTNHKPYCLSTLSANDLKKNKAIADRDDIIGFQTVKKYDVVRDREITMTKIVATNPLAIGGKSGSIRNKLSKSWESYIRYYKCYTFDRKLTPGMLYKIKNGELLPVKVELPKKEYTELWKRFEEAPEESKELLLRLLPKFFTSIPDIKRIAIDIEIFTPFTGRIPDPNEPTFPVLCISIVENEGLQKVLLLKRDGVEKGVRPENFPIEVELEFYDDERELIKRIFEILMEYPLVLTFNGDNFDLLYLYKRAELLGFDQEEIPLIISRDIISRYRVLLNYGIHVDLYRFFMNASIKNYAFGSKYKLSNLEAISRALINAGKIELEKEISELTLMELAHYCWWDSYLTLKLTEFDNNLVLKLIILLMRISHLSMEDLTRESVSSWIRNLLYFEHRIHDYLIPRPEDIKGKAVTKAIIKDKKYKGAIVVKPVPGVHWSTIVLDFSSLYPSIIKQWNLSYETVNCRHGDCNKKIPGTSHRVCTKRRGISSLLIGLLRDMRIFWFKPKSKEREIPEEIQNLYDVVQNSLKVIINAAYGTFGSENFPLYCIPVAESTTAIGRYAITQTIEKARSLDMNVIYGDTDSVFIEQPTEEQINQLIDWSKKELEIDLDIEKKYRYLALSDRKKNYLGVFDFGAVDVKGLVGKKRNTPMFLQEVFLKIIHILSEIIKPEDFEKGKSLIREIIHECYEKLNKKEYTLEDLAFKVQLSKAPSQYIKTTPQHVKAARQLESIEKREIRAGDVISFVKTRTEPGVRPLELADIYEIDIEKYKSHIETTLSQVLDALSINIEEFEIRKLDAFF